MKFRRLAAIAMAAAVMATMAVSVNAEAEETTAEETTAEETTAEETTAEETTDEADDGEAAEDDDAEDADDDDGDEEFEDDDDDDDDDDDGAEIDWDSYDEAAAKAANENFQFMVDDGIDLYAALGDDYTELATVVVTFNWEDGSAWCGGAGIGNGAVTASGQGWVAGPEYGAANANIDLADLNTATQTVVDLTNDPLVSIASVGDDGVTSFGKLFLQNWWNGDVAKVTVSKIQFLDASGSVLAEYNYGGDELIAPAATGDVDAATDSSKGSPDTGIADVAAVAGLGVLAAGAVIVAKKRK